MTFDLELYLRGDLAVTLPISWIMFICGSNTTHEGWWVMYHLQVNRSKVKVTRDMRIFAIGVGYPSRSRISSWFRLGHGACSSPSRYLNQWRLNSLCIQWAEGVLRQWYYRSNSMSSLTQIDISLNTLIKMNAHHIYFWSVVWFWTILLYFVQMSHAQTPSFHGINLI